MKRQRGGLVLIGDALSDLGGSVQARETGCRFIVAARKTLRLLEELKAGSLDGFSGNRRRCAVRVSIPARGLGCGLPVPGAAL